MRRRVNGGGNVTTHEVREMAVSIPADRDLEEIMSHYPQEKPVCFNYMRARLDVLYLSEIVRQLRGCRHTDGEKLEERRLYHD